MDSVLLLSHTQSLTGLAQATSQDFKAKVNGMPTGTDSQRKREGEVLATVQTVLGKLVTA